jgi:uncharacterized protein YjbI with pentapeptide repeats
MRGANLQNAVLDSVTLRYADLRDTNLSGVKFRSVDTHRAVYNLSTRWPASVSRNIRGRAILVRPNARLAGVDLSGAHLDGEDLRNAVLTGADLASTKLAGADLSGADLQKADMFYAEVMTARLANANLRDANLRHARFDGADLRGADLTGADTTASTFREAKYDRSTRWPVGFDPDAAGARVAEPDG